MFRYAVVNLRKKLCVTWRCAHSRRILCNLVKRERFARIMSNVERYKNLYFCDCA